MKTITLLGSTGSVGQNTLEVIRHFKHDFKVFALAAKKNSTLLEKQIFEFKPQIAVLFDEKAAADLRKKVSCPVLSGAQGLLDIVQRSEVDLVVAAMNGLDGLSPVLAGIEAGKTIALANKETLVAAGSLVMDKARQNKVQILPVDSEHSAIFQCLTNEPRESLKRIILTASGGPFFQKSLEELQTVTLKAALHHPTYQMGRKITVDSSTLMNKGLEVIEAHFLFGVQADKIDVVVHPQSLIHSFVEFSDHAILAQMSYPDMKLPIQYALHYPQRSPATIKSFDFTSALEMRFYPPDLKKFKCLALAYETLKMGKSAPCYLNGANEILVQRFLKGEILWREIGEKLEKLISSHIPENMVDLKAILEVDLQARRKAAEA